MSAQERWPLLMKRETAAAFLDIGTRTLSRMMAANQVKWVRLPGLPGTLRIRRSDLETLVEDLKHEPPQPDVNRQRAQESD